MVDSLTKETVALLGRTSSPALSIDEVREELERNRPGSPLPDNELLTALQSDREEIHLLPHPKRRWAHVVGPRAWILVPRKISGNPGGRAGIRAKLRATLTALGRDVEPGSTRGWARWTRMLEEEHLLHRILQRQGQKEDEVKAERDSRK